MEKIRDQTPRYSLLQRLQGIGQRVLLRFAQQQVDVLWHDYIPINAEPVTAPHPGVPSEPVFGLLGCPAVLTLTRKFDSLRRLQTSDAGCPRFAPVLWALTWDH
jgi:hypothetical protein